MFSPPSLDSSSRYLELYVRAALQSGYLSPAMESHINVLVEKGNLSERDRTLIQILQDAILEGCVQHG